MRLASDEDLSRLRARGLSSGDHPSPRYDRDRLCVVVGCPTQLSIYNAGARCWAHTEPIPTPLTVRRRSRRVA